jgi:hypothetical protein
MGFKLDLSSWGPVTMLLVAITTIAAIAGSVVCIVHPETLTFEQLLSQLQKFAIGLGLLGIGRGIHNQGKAIAGTETATQPADAVIAPAQPTQPATAGDSTVSDAMLDDNPAPDAGDAGAAEVAGQDDEPTTELEPES